jgi:eukaryotic-like serine/threonine-protein kinase
LSDVGSTKLIDSEQGGVQRIGRYELIAEIASGGMATVYLARLSGVGGFQRNVAIKCLHPHLARDNEFVEMFLDEARLAALIHHPNVVPILEVGEGDAGYFLVMDYVEGDTFATLLSRAALEGKDVPRDISMRILVDMLSGLHAAHELRDDDGRLLGLVHRDVSPQNILVGTDGVTRITDFGVARAASRLSATRAGQLKGKLAYMAPEQAGGEEEVDRRADVFSAGVVLWEALALKRLFKASNEAATLSRVLNDRIVSPREFSTEVPEDVARVCLKALQRDLNARFVSCGEFGDALERAAASTACLATPREVAAYVQEVVGPSVESHRRAIRTWLQKRGRVGESSMPSIRAPAQLPPPPSRRPGMDTSSVTQTGALPPPSLPPAPASVLSSRLAYHPPRPGVSVPPPASGGGTFGGFGPGGAAAPSTTPTPYSGPAAAATLVSALPPPPLPSFSPASQGLLRGRLGLVLGAGLFTAVGVVGVLVWLKAQTPTSAALPVATPAALEPPVVASPSAAAVIAVPPTAAPSTSAASPVSDLAALQPADDIEDSLDGTGNTRTERVGRKSSGVKARAPRSSGANPRKATTKPRTGPDLENPYQ